MPNIHIIGKGAIGLLYGYYLQPHYAVTLCLRAQLPHSHFNYWRNDECTAFAPKIEDIESQDKIECVIIPTKAFSVLDAFNAIKPRLSKHAVIILSHNGMGSIELIAPLLRGQQQLFFLTTTQAAYKRSQQDVIHTGYGMSNLGAVNAAAKANQAKVFKNLSVAIPDLHLVDNIEQLLWQKLIINVAINPLSAINQVKNGQLTQPKYASQVLHLVHEAYQLALVQGVKIELHKVLYLVYKVMRDTADNFSSMNRDIAAGQPSEIEAICGYIVQLGQQYNLATPYNMDMLKQINHYSNAKKSAPDGTLLH